MTNYRTFQPDLEVRAAAQGGDGRTVVGIAVPYGRAQRIHEDLTEQFAHGAFDGQIRAMTHRGQGVPFTREHLPFGGTLIGATRLLRNDAAGLYGEWYVSKTPAGDETLELLRDGALSHLSIGFRERKNKRLPDGTIERTRAELREVAVVMEGAYGEAAMVSGTRSASDHDDDQDDDQDDGTGGDTGAGEQCRCGARPRLLAARGQLLTLPTLPPPPARR